MTSTSCPITIHCYLITRFLDLSEVGDGVAIGKVAQHPVREDPPHQVQPKQVEQRAHLKFKMEFKIIFVKHVHTIIVRSVVGANVSRHALYVPSLVKKCPYT